PAAIEFVARLQEHLGDRLGPLLLQLPPSYGPARWTDLTAFLQGLRAKLGAVVSLALEVRHADWFAGARDNRLNEFLASHQIGRILLDTRPVYLCPDDPQLTSERRKPNLPVQPTITAEFGIVRFISHPDPKRNQPYWDYWCDRLLTWQKQHKRVYFFVHCPNEVRSPANLKALFVCLQQRGIIGDFTPEDVSSNPQLSLFD
ncbi:MAG: DUF72 domain-containing protein, partial [Cyanobacteria bacterium J06641_5]